MSQNEKDKFMKLVECFFLAFKGYKTTNIYRIWFTLVLITNDMILRAMRKVDVVFGIDHDRIWRESLNSRCGIIKRFTSNCDRLKIQDVSRLIVYFVLSKKIKNVQRIFAKK